MPLESCWVKLSDSSDSQSGVCSKYQEGEAFRAFSWNLMIKIKTRGFWAFLMFCSILTCGSYFGASPQSVRAAGTTPKGQNDPGQQKGFEKTGESGEQTKRPIVEPSLRLLFSDSFLRSLAQDLGDLSVSESIRPNQIGIGRKIGLQTNGSFRTVLKGSRQIDALVLRSPKAVGLRIHIEGMHLADGESLFIYGLDGSIADSKTEITGSGPFGNGEFWSDVTLGDTVVIERVWDDSDWRDMKGSDFTVSEVSHLIENPLSGLNTVGACEVDARCGTQQPEKNSVARIIFTSGGQTFACSGTVLATTNTDKSPYVLTANHCVGTAAEAQTVQAFWFYQSIACNSNTLQSGIFVSPTGASILQTSAGSDQTLLEILGVIPRNLFYSGWNTNAQSTGGAVFSLHHPGTGFPAAGNQIESYLRRSTGSITAQNQSCPATGVSNAYQVTWTEGVAEPGSDGAGLFITVNGTNFLTGVLTGCGSSACGQPANLQTDNFGRFSDFAPLITANLAGGSDDGFEPNDTRATASPVVSVTASNLIVKENNEDWYSISAGPGQTVNATANFTHVWGDIDLELYRNGESTPVAVSNGTSNTENISFLNTSGTNTFYLRVLLFNDTRNSYSLGLNLDNCSFSINPTSSTVGSSGASGTVTVMASNAGCAWTATSNTSWITITSGATGTGNGTVGYSVSANTSIERTGTVTIAGQTFTVTQANGCTYSINPTSTTIAAAGGTGTVAVTASDTACPWTAVSNNSFITITSGATGTGNGSVGYTVAANTGIQRTGTVTIAGQTFTVTQSNGCTYSINPTSTTIAAAGGTGTVAVTASDTACPWTAVSNNSFITITSGATGTGNGSVGYTVAANTGIQRVGTVTIAGQTFTVTQSNGCTYSINPTSTTIAAAGGTGTVAVTASDSACPWTAVSNDSFITITSGATGTGNGTVGYLVASNLGPDRTGTLTIAGQTFTVTQPGCQFVVAPTSFQVTWKGGKRKINVTTTSGCPVLVSGGPSWITILPGGPTLDVNVQLARNTGAARTGTITVAGQTITFNQTARSASTPGQFRPSNGFVYLRNSNDTGFANNQFFYGQASDIPIAGDWDGDGIDTIGIYRNGTFFLRNSNSSGFADIQFPFGIPGDIPIAGDWDGDGIDTIGIVRGNGVFLRNTNTAGNADIQFNYGLASDIFIVGDWNGDGIDTIGAYRPTNGFVYIRNSNTTGIADFEFFYGQAGDRPVVGDWNADGIDTIGIVRGNQWFLRNSNTSGFADIQFFYGVDTDTPVTGDWDGQ